MSEDRDGNRRTDPGALSPSEIAQRFLDDRKVENTKATLRSYRGRLIQFVQWCDAQGIERIDELTGWDLDEYRNKRQAEVAPATLKGNLMAVKQMLDYADRIGAVDDDLGDKVPLPKLTREQLSSDIKLATDDAKELLEYYRDSPADFGTPEHTLLEVLWNVGCRVGAVRGLDLGDFYPEEQYIDFRHRPDTGTPLKNKKQGERPVAIPEQVVSALEMYIARERTDNRDKYGREPLFATPQGRIVIATLRAWNYQGTQPCVYGPCPHGEDPRTCKYRKRSHASKCPSSRSPHQIRTGSITWQLDRGLPVEVVAERVNALPDTIRRYYDKATGLEKLENRRREYTRNFDISQENTNSTDEESNGENNPFDIGSDQ